MKRLVLGIALLTAFSGGAAVAQVDSDTIQRAANGVIQLRSRMKDPDSFVLEAAYLKKPDKHGKSEVCFYYRARNSYGGYGETGETVLLKNDSLFMVDSKDRSNPFFSLLDPCRPSTRASDITAEVQRALHPSALDEVHGPADRPKLIMAEKEGFKKDGAAGYAEIIGDTYIVHSERANSIRFHANMLEEKEYMDALRRAEIKTLVYTNDADKRFVYDIVSGQIAIGDVAPTSTPLQNNSEDAPR